MHIPAFAWLIAGIFWSVLLVRRYVRRRQSGGDGSGVSSGDAGPAWSPTRRGGGF